MRDAAAYVCWAFGRAYYHTDMKSVLEELAPHLLAVACYDREVIKGIYNVFLLVFPFVGSTKGCTYSCFHNNEALHLLLG